MLRGIESPEGVVDRAKERSKRTWWYFRSAATQLGGNAALHRLVRPGQRIHSGGNGPVLSVELGQLRPLVAQAAFQDIAVAAGADLSGEDIQLGAEVAYAVRDARESGGQLGAANGRAREGLCRIGERALR